ncbi:MAG: hypothetical protein HY283_00805 [Nitrospirae bacterium]|nr:hypothetical protein [Nitrospirota bacterium]
MEQNELLRYVVRSLEEIGIPYMIGGSLASSAYGEPRLTNDIDIVADLAPGHVQALLTKFPPDEYYLDEDKIKEAMARRGQFNIIHPSSGYKVDIFISGQDAHGRSQLSRRRRLEAPDGEHAFFASPEDVVLKKMEYFRIGESERQLRDIVGMLRVQGDRLDRPYILHWAAEMGLVGIWETILRRLGEK